MNKYSVVAFFLGAAIVFSSHSMISSAKAQITTFDIWVPQGTTLIGTDKAIVTGKRGGLTTLTNGVCTMQQTGLFPAQTIVAVDPGGGGATRFAGVVFSAEAAPGTKLGSITTGNPATCTDGGVAYNHYVGIVE